MSLPPFCCDDLRSAYAITFLNPVPDQEDWLAYGTDFETVSAGVPELRFWPVRYCPFCGARLPPAGARGGATVNHPDATDAQNDTRADA